jgi:hypothetical protein
MHQSYKKTLKDRITFKIGITTTEKIEMSA